MKRSIFLAIALFLAINCQAQQKSWGERMAETIMKSNPDSIVVKAAKDSEQRPATWNYEYGVLFESFEQLWKQTGNRAYYSYIKKIMDHFIGADGAIRTYDLLEYNIDHITPGRALMIIYKETKEDKYKKALTRLHDQLLWQPRTKEGGYWHKLRYPYQMWLDGLYMGETFAAEYALEFDDIKKFDDIASQFTWMENHSRDANTGLLYHAWDESKQQKWADPVTGRAPGFWARGMGWYGMALVDVLDYFPKDHPKRKDLIAILQRFAVAIKNYQDPASGVWYQVLDKGTLEGNYLEASASAMFTYSLAKGIRLGYLDKSFVPVVKKSFEGMLENFIETDPKGLIHLTKVVSVGGLGGNPYRDGSFEYYISEPLRTDDLKGVGPFIQASVEMELIKK
ncbi:MAG: glycoside hydrolase family 88 protein [Chryseolinea sp.]